MTADELEGLAKKLERRTPGLVRRDAERALFVQNLDRASERLRGLVKQVSDRLGWRNSWMDGSVMADGASNRLQLGQRPRPFVFRPGAVSFERSRVVAFTSRSSWHRRASCRSGFCPRACAGPDRSAFEPSHGSSVEKRVVGGALGPRPLGRGAAGRRRDRSDRRHRRTARRPAQQHTQAGAEAGYRQAAPNLRYWPGGLRPRRLGASRSPRGGLMTSSITSCPCRTLSDFCGPVTGSTKS